MSQATAPRRYISQLRQEQARATRERVVRAAAELFGSRGYRATKLSDIAALAGVSVETVQGHGPKLDLLQAAVELVSFGVEGEMALLESPLGEAYLEAATLEELVAVGAHVQADINQRVVGVWRALSSASDGEPAVRERARRMMASIRASLGQMVHLVRARGWLTTSTPPQEIVASLWALGMPEAYDRLTGELGWSHEQYVAWYQRRALEIVRG